MSQNFSPSASEVALYLKLLSFIETDSSLIKETLTTEERARLQILCQQFAEKVVTIKGVQLAPAAGDEPNIVVSSDSIASSASMESLCQELNSMEGSQDMSYILILGQKSTINNITGIKLLQNNETESDPSSYAVELSRVDNITTNTSNSLICSTAENEQENHVYHAKKRKTRHSSKRDEAEVLPDKRITRSQVR